MLRHSSPSASEFRGHCSTGAMLTSLEHCWANITVELKGYCSFLSSSLTRRDTGTEAPILICSCKLRREPQLRPSILAEEELEMTEHILLQLLRSLKGRCALQPRGGVGHNAPRLFQNQLNNLESLSTALLTRTSRAINFLQQSLSYSRSKLTFIASKDRLRFHIFYATIIRGSVRRWA